MSFIEYMIVRTDVYLEQRDWCKCCQAMHSPGVNCECLS